MTTLPELPLTQARIVGWPPLDNPGSFAEARAALRPGYALVATYGGRVYPVPTAEAYGVLVAWRARFYGVPTALVEGGG